MVLSCSLSVDFYFVNGLNESCYNRLMTFKSPKLYFSAIKKDYLGLEMPAILENELDNGSSSETNELFRKRKDDMHAADILEELGYASTSSVSQCKSILSLSEKLNVEEIARILGMVARTHTGLKVQLGFLDAFNVSMEFEPAALEGNEAVTSWNLDCLLSAINELVSEIDWASVVEHLDFEGFHLPDQEAFLTLMAFYSKATSEPFPTFEFCKRIWKNSEGQLSFLTHASTASSEILSFASSPRLQPPIEDLHGHKSSTGSSNQAWLSLDFLDILCQLGEAGHVAEVHSILDHPIKQYPELLIIGLAQIKTELNLIQYEVMSALLPSYLSTNPNSSILLHLLWPINHEIILSCMVEMHAKDPTSISRLLDVCQDLKILSTALETSPFSFAIDLAALASRREYLNLEKWLQDGITQHKDILFQACLDFLREKTLLETKGDGSSLSSSRPAPVINLSLETTAVFFKVLQSTAPQLNSQELAEEMKRVYSSAVRANPRLLTIASSEQNSSEVFSTDIEEEANSYFQRIYVGELNIEEVVEMLKRFNKSSVQREQEIFACMIQSLFDEYRFFPRYPDKELRITAFLFGSIIKHQLVSSLTLGIALRCVLESLKKHVDSKMFSFGLTALELFKERLFEWPQYCNHILQISHLREIHPEMIEFVEKTLNQTQTQTQSPTIQNQSQTPSPTLPQTQTQSTTVPQTQTQTQSTSTSLNQTQDSASVKGPEPNPPSPKPAETPQTPEEVAEIEKNEQIQPPDETIEHSTEILDQNSEIQPQSQEVDAAVTETPNITKPPEAPTQSKPQKIEMLRSTKPSSTRPAQPTGFGTALNIETLVAAAEKRESPIEVPSSEIQDKVSFIINNISMSNFETKATDMVELFNNKYFPWFAQYIVMKRSSIEPNFHDLYIKFLDKMASKELLKEIIKATYENCKVLLRSELIKISSEERSLLKNLGSWLGKLTIGRNQALRAKEIDPKSLIIEAYEKGLMIAIIPFTSKILEPCQSSLAYQPPNPWTMGILGLLTEIYNLPNLKMNLKFDIEVLFKNLSVDMKDVKPTQLLKGRTREIEGNPDFSTKETITPLAPSPPLEQTRIPPLTEPSPSPSPSLSPPPSSIPAPAPSPLQEVEEKVDRSAAPPPLSSASPSPSFSFPQVSQSLPNLSSYIVLNPKVSYLGPQLNRYVTTAMDRAIREIIQPVVDRSVTIACMTTRELVMKDFALESEEMRTHKAANLMVSSLAGSLAHVTCKEPLRVAMSSHLRNLLQGNALISDMDATVNFITNDNLDLGCAVIEKAATEKALREIEDSLIPALSMRRKQREALGSAFFDASVYSQGNLARLPESLRPKPGRLSPIQQRVYEDYSRLSWQNQATAPQHPSATNLQAQTQGQSQTVSAASLGLVQTGRTSLGALNQPSFAKGMNAQTNLPPAREAEVDKMPPLQMNASFSAPISVPPELSKTQHQDLFPSSIVQMENMNANVEIPASDVPQTSQLPPQEQLLSIPEALEKITSLIQKLDSSISKFPQMRFSTLPNDHEVRTFVSEIIKYINQCMNRDELAIGIAQKVFKHLYDDASNALHVSTFLHLLECIKDTCMRVIKELTNWLICSEEDRKFGNREITFSLIQSDLLFLPELSFHLSKVIDNGRNVIATDFSIHLLRSCIQDGISNPLDFTPVIEVLSKIAQRPGAPESLQQLIEIVRTANLKDDKSKILKEKKGLQNRTQIAKDENKPVAKELLSPIPINFSEQALQLFDSWMSIYDSPNSNEKSHSFFITQFYQSGILKGDETVEWFFRLITEVVVNHCVSETLSYGPPQTSQNLQFNALDAYAKLIVLIVKFYVDPNGAASSAKINLLDKVLQAIVKVIHRDADEKKTNFNARPYFRLFISLITDFTLPDPAYEFSNLQVLNVFYITFHSLQPIRVPGFSFSWLELISHRLFMPKLLLANGQKGWPLFQKLLVALFKYLEIYLRNAELCDPVRLLYKGTLRVLLVLLHDFPEFLCDYHFNFCDVIPPSCIQMRNLILSAFPRNMRLPDPFTPNLKVDLLPEISQSPKISSEYDLMLKNKGLKNELDEYLMNRQPHTFLHDFKQRLLLSPQESLLFGLKYNAPLINALVLSVGIRGISLLQGKSGSQPSAQGGTAPAVAANVPLSSSAPMDIFQRLITDLDSEGRYLFLNAIANQLRYPNNQTHYFSCVLLWLFAEASQEVIQEQITRVLLERLIVNRPHPWGLLITFIELIKNPRYNFWSHGFTRCAPEIEKLFESVARSCMGSPVARRTMEEETNPNPNIPNASETPKQ